MFGELREFFQLSHGQVEHFSDLPNRRLQSIRGEGADEPCVLVAVLLIDAQDELFADVPREVEVDVGHAAQGFVEESAQEEVVLHRVDVRKPYQVADDRRYRGATSPARRKARTRPRGFSANFPRDRDGQVHDVAVDEEKPCEPVQIHEPKLRVQTFFGVLFLRAARFVER